MISQPNEMLLSAPTSRVLGPSAPFKPSPAATKLTFVGRFSLPGTLTVEVENNVGEFEVLATAIMAGVTVLNLDYNPGTVRVRFTPTEIATNPVTGWLRATYSGHAGNPA